MASEVVVGPRAIVGVRARLIEAATVAWEIDWRAYFRGLEKRYLREGPELLAVKAAPSAFWQDEQGVVGGILTQEYQQMYTTVLGEIIPGQVGGTVGFRPDVQNLRGFKSLIATKVTRITETTRGLLRSAITIELERTGSSDDVEKAVQKALRHMGESGGRAHIIALTESANAYNFAALTGYGESGIVEMVRVYDGADCGWRTHDDGDKANGTTRTLEDAHDHPIAHPHCQRAFGPVVLEEAPRAQVTPPKPVPVPQPKPVQVPPKPVKPDVADDPRTFAFRTRDALRELSVRLADQIGRRSRLGSLTDVGGPHSIYEKNALQTYKGSGYAGINRYWYDRPRAMLGNDGSPSWLREQSDLLDGALSKVPALKEDVVSYRGMSGRLLADAKVGSTITYHGYLSTSIDQGVAAKFVFGKDNPTIVRILSRKGSRHGYYYDLPGSEWESEVLIRRGAKMRVLRRGMEEVYGPEGKVLVNTLDVVIEGFTKRYGGKSRGIKAREVRVTRFYDEDPLVLSIS